MMAAVDNPELSAIGKSLQDSFDTDDRMRLGISDADITTPYQTFGDRYRQNGVVRLHYTNGSHYDSIVYER